MEKLGGAFKMNRRVRLTIIVLATIFMHVYCGLELMFGTLITSYAVKCDLQLDKATGAVMASVYWAFFTFFRLFAIFFADIIGAENNIYFNFSLIALSNFFLLPFGGSNVYCLWIGIVLMGLGTSSIWASIFGFLEDYFPVTSGITAAFSVAACLGQSIMPFIVGYFIDKYPPIFLWVTLAASLALIILFSVYSYLCKHCLRKKTLS
jgi:fucose permease